LGGRIYASALYVFLDIASTIERFCVSTLGSANQAAVLQFFS
jgi:hypothetical protein